MGQKVHPASLRIGVIRTWDSKWFSQKNYTELVKEDYKIRKYIKDRLGYAAISKVEIERSAERVIVSIHTAKPGVIIGKKGSEVDILRAEIGEMTGKEVYVTPVEVSVPELDSQLVAESIARQLEKRISYRRAMKKAIVSVLSSGAKGVKIMVAGRLGGSEIARVEWYREGSVPSHTFRADIDFGKAESYTTYGRIGVKVWIYKGDVLEKKEQEVVLLKESMDVISQESKV